MWGMLSALPAMTGLFWRKRAVIWAIACRDFNSETQGSYLGVFWAYFQPLLYVILLTLVFSLGLRHNPAGKDLPFMVFLISGMIPWLFLSGSLGGLTGVIKNHSYLVRKGDTPLILLPASHLLSRLFTHAVLMAAVIAVAWYHGRPPGLMTLQLFYYLAASMGLLMGLGLITSSTCLFVSDVKQLVTVVVQFGFWFTPIIWNIDLLPDRYRWVVKLNPAAYIVEGYRKSILGTGYFWDNWLWGLYYWGFTLAVLFGGAFVFRRLKPHFGEVTG